MGSAEQIQHPPAEILQKPGTYISAHKFLRKCDKYKKSDCFPICYLTMATSQPTRAAGISAKMIPGNSIPFA